MQFREQAKKLQFIRSVYNQATKRCDQKMVGSISSYAKEMPPDGQLEMLTAKEKIELSAYLAKKKADYEKLMTWSALQNSDKTLSDLADAILSAETVTTEKAAEIWRGVTAVSKALKKAGHPKSSINSKDVNEQLSMDLPAAPADPLPPVSPDFLPTAPAVAEKSE